MRTRRRSIAIVSFGAVVAALCASGALPAAATPAAAPTAVSTTASATPTVVINEIESSGGVPGDWVELMNTGTSAADVTGWSILDNDDSHTAVPLPAGSVIAPGGYLVLDESFFGFGLGAPDSVRLFDADHALVDSYDWAKHATTAYGRCPDGTGDFVTTVSSTKGTANDCAAAPASPVKINEIESSGGDPGDWIELTNTSSSTVDISDYILRDDKDSDAFIIPAGTTIAPGGFLAEDVESSFGLGSADSARLFAPDGTTLVDSYSWTQHAATTYGRCPDGTGDFTTTSAPTKGAANDCSSTSVGAAWPGGTAIRAVDDANVFGENLSGLVYQASGTAQPGVLWAVKNGPSTLYRLVWNGSVWTPDAANGWAAGKALRYPDGTGDPDSEGVTMTDAGPSGGIYVSTERDNTNNGTSRPEVLRYDVSADGTTLSATAEWNLTADLPAVGANLGLEGVTWIPDSYLTAHGFRDEHTGAAYTPSSYPGHGSGLFFVGLEANGTIYAYALNQSGGYTRVATITSGFVGVMEVQFDQETQALWAVCDDNCDGRTETLRIAQTGQEAGRFVVDQVYARPSGMPNLNNEGFVMAPQAECVDGRKPVFWSDDSNDDGHALRAGTVDCTVLSEPGGGDPAAATIHLDAGTVTAGSRLHLSAAGFTPGEIVDVVLHSTPVTLAGLVANGSGAIDATVTIPVSTPAGAHTISVTGRTSTVTGSAPLTVRAATVGGTGLGGTGAGGTGAGSGSDPAVAGGADAAARLAETGSSPGGVLGWALGATAAGIALLALAVLRRRRSS